MKIKEFNDNLQEVNLGGMLAAAGGAVARGLNNVGQIGKNIVARGERENPKQAALTTGQKISHDPMNAQRKIDMYEKQLKNLVNKFYQESIAGNNPALIKIENQYKEVLKAYELILPSNKNTRTDSVVVAAGGGQAVELEHLNIVKNKLILEISQNIFKNNAQIYKNIAILMTDHTPGSRDDLQKLKDEYKKLGVPGSATATPVAIPDNLNDFTTFYKDLFKKTTKEKEAVFRRFQEEDPTGLWLIKLKELHDKTPDPNTLHRIQDVGRAYGQHVPELLAQLGIASQESTSTAIASATTTSGTGSKPKADDIKKSLKGELAPPVRDRIVAKLQADGIVESKYINKHTIGEDINQTIDQIKDIAGEKSDIVLKKLGDKIPAIKQQIAASEKGENVKASKPRALASMLYSKLVKANKKQREDYENKLNKYVKYTMKSNGKYIQYEDILKIVKFISNPTAITVTESIDVLLYDSLDRENIFKQAIRLGKEMFFI